VIPSSSGTPLAGSNYSLVCSAVKNVNGLLRPIQLEWIDPNGHPVVNGSGITVEAANSVSTMTTQTLTFGSLHTSHGGEYTCQATLESPALTVFHVAMQAQNITVAGILIYLCFLLETITLNYTEHCYIVSEQGVVTCSSGVRINANHFLPSYFSYSINLCTKWSHPSG